MNPDFLFPTLNCTRWQYIWIDRELRKRPYFKMMCECQREPVVQWVKPIAKTMTVIEMAPHAVMYKDERSIVFVGVCEHCGVAYWTATDFEFLMSMKDIQMLDAVLGTLQVSRCVFENVLSIRNEGEQDLRFLFDRDGKFERII